jgi:2,4-dienoyl-CoA reductase-like NADH-dependent reductase (Old Yellow Enzyme family)
LVPTCRTVSRVHTFNHSPLHRTQISPEDAGIWQDSQIPPLKRIVDFCHSQGTLIGIQLGHAGRKASTLSTWVHQDLDKNPEYDGLVKGRYVAAEEAGGWPDNGGFRRFRPFCVLLIGFACAVQAPSAIPFSEKYPEPKEMTAAKIEEFKRAFTDAIERAKKAGFDFIEIHGAHVRPKMLQMRDTRVD